MGYWRAKSLITSQCPWSLNREIRSAQTLRILGSRASIFFGVMCGSTRARYFWVSGGLTNEGINGSASCSGGTVASRPDPKVSASWSRSRTSA